MPGKCEVRKDRGCSVKANAVFVKRSEKLWHGKETSKPNGQTAEFKTGFCWL
jgi:hypothetical protein